MNCVVILLFLTLVKSDSDESKYVDLLPEEEKREFLETVARRIIENAEIKEVSNKTSVEISDDELKQHEAFVNQILKEESSNMRRNRMEKEVGEEEFRGNSMEHAQAVDEGSVRSKRMKRLDNGKSAEISVEVITDVVQIQSSDKNTAYNIESSKEDIEVIPIQESKPVTVTSNIEDNNQFTHKFSDSIQSTTEDLNGTRNLNQNKTVTNSAESSKEELQSKNVKRRAVNDTAPETEDLVHDTVEINENDTLLFDEESQETTTGQRHTIMDEYITPDSSEKRPHTECSTTVHSSHITSTRTTVPTTKKPKKFKINEFTAAVYSDVDTKEVTDTSDCNDYKMETTEIVKRNVDGITVNTVSRRSNDEFSSGTTEAYITEISTESTSLNNEIVTDKIIDDKSESNVSYKEINRKMKGNRDVLKDNDNDMIVITIPPIIIDLNNYPYNLSNNSETRASEVKEKKSNINTIVANSNIDVNGANITTSDKVTDTLVQFTEINLKNNDTEVSVVNNVTSTEEPPTAITANSYIETTVGTKDNEKEDIGIKTVQFVSTPDIKPELKIVNKTLLTTSERTTEYIEKPIHITTDMVKTTKSNNKHDTTYKTKNKKKSVKTMSNIEKPIVIADTAINMLRDSLLLVTGDKKQDDVFKELQKEYTKQHHEKYSNKYEVYEIPYDKPPFIKNSKAATEQPYYVPVYDYSPNKAYFNAENRLGPNADDDPKLTIKDIKSYNDGSLENEDAVSGTFIDTDNFDMQRKFSNHAVKHQKQRRKHVKRANDVRNFVFPDTDDESHPSRSMREKDFKDHIRAVRNILYQNNIFSYPYKTKKKDVDTNADQAEDMTAFSTRTKRAQKTAIKLGHSGHTIPKRKHKNPYKHVGYFRKYNNTSHVFVDDAINGYLSNYLNSLKYKSNNYVANDNPATANTAETDEVNEPKIFVKVPKIESDLRDSTIENVQNDRDVLRNMTSLKNVNNTMFRNLSDEVKTYVKVLKDMVHVNDDALKQYDWMGTTVDLQSALEKLFGLVEAIQNDDEIHPSDLELLKYVIFLHKFSTELLENQDQLRKKLMLPRNKKKRKGILNEKGLLNRVWLRKELGETGKKDLIDNFQKFLTDLQESMFGLHEAIKNIAKITKYTKQNWYTNIKDLYLRDEKSYFTLLLHLTAARLFGLIEESSTAGIEDNFKRYVRVHRKETLKAAEELMFILSVVNEIKRN